MSVTVTQSPTTPNAAYTRLVYVASGSVTTSEPQYQYVMDVYESGSTDLITRLTQVPNPEGVGVFDPSPILQGQLDIDNNWKTKGTTAPVSSVLTFDIRFGEQYGTSDSSSVTVYTGSTSNYLEVFPGIVNENNGQSFNFNTSSFVGGGNPYLTNDPAAQTPDLTPLNEYAYLVNSTDYMTVTAFQENYGTEGYIRLNGSKVVNGAITPVLQDALTFPSLDAKFTTLGVGPQNMADYLPSWKTAIDNGDINLIYSSDDPGGFAIYINDLWDGVPAASSNGRLKGIKDPLKQCSDEYTRFAFINRYGFWDYYNVYNPVKTNTDLERSNFNNSKVNYSTLLSPYNANRRGDTQYYLSSTDKYSIDTNYLDKDMANWLEELMESPSVYLQEGSNFVPIIITNTEYKTNNSTARNKLFKYTIEWEYANARRSRI